MEPIAIFWFRRDLRIHDNTGLFHALTSGLKVLPIFIFDTCILDKLDDKADPRVTFLYDTIAEIRSRLQSEHSDMDIRVGDPVTIFQELTVEYNVSALYFNHDYERYAIDRDNAVKSWLDSKKIELYSFKDHVIFEKDEVVKDDQKPYTVFTPYKNKWLNKLTNPGDEINESKYFASYRSEDYTQHFLHFDEVKPLMSLDELGFVRSAISIPGAIVSQKVIVEYDQNRDFPAINGTTRLGLHFRFGTISIREKARKAAQLNKTYLSELIWRDFYAMILYHFPYVQDGPFRKEYANIEWVNNVKQFEAWCLGKTGYPIVDAGMRELLATGHMHNRVRMVVASFLTKHLLIDWRWGEAWFAKKLLDFDLASNNGGWQWAAGCGTDAAPYFRIFSPDAQTERFDKSKIYIKKWVPEYCTPAYPKPIINHKDARERCLAVYKAGLAKNEIA